MLELAGRDLEPESPFPHLQNGDNGAIVSLKRCMHIKSLAQHMANGRKDYSQWWMFLLVETFKLMPEKEYTKILV